MRQDRREFGANHPRDGHVAVFEFNLDELRALEGWVPYKDGFIREIREAIEWLEAVEEPKEGGYGLYLALVVEEGR